MVPDLTHLRPPRQEVLQVPPPARRVITLAVAAGGSPIQDRLHPAADTARRLGLGGPDRLQDIHDEARVDLLDRQRSDNRVGVGLESASPLVSMLGVPPAGLVGRDVALAALPERHGLGRLELRGFLAGLGRLDRIYAILQLASACGGLPPRVGEADIPEGAQAHRAGPAAQHEPERATTWRRLW